MPDMRTGSPNCAGWSPTSPHSPSFHRTAAQGKAEQQQTPLWLFLFTWAPFKPFFLTYDGSMAASVCFPRFSGGVWQTATRRCAVSGRWLTAIRGVGPGRIDSTSILRQEVGIKYAFRGIWGSFSDVTTNTVCALDAYRVCKDPVVLLPCLLCWLSGLSHRYKLNHSAVSMLPKCCGSLLPPSSHSQVTAAFPLLKVEPVKRCH